MERLLTLLATIPPGCSHGFLGLEPWYNFLQVSNPPSCQVQNFYIFPGGGNSSSVPLVLVAIVDDLLRIAGIIAVGFVIYGAIKFIASEGNPDATTQARGTVINALVGLAIAVTGVALVSFIGKQLGK